MNKIIVPTINNNETQAKLVEWLVEDNSNVSKGDLVAVLETTKATVDLEVEHDGIIKIIGLKDNEYDFGTTIGWIYNDKSELNQIINEGSLEDKNDTQLNITKPAREFMLKNKINENDLLNLDLSIIKVKDLEKLLEKKEDSSIEIIDPIQVTIGNTVSISKKTIPDAFQVKKINISKTLEKINDYSIKNGFKFGLPELIIFSISRLIKKNSFFFGKILDDNKFKKSNSANVGITLDLGKGLYVPVIKNCDSLSLEEISTILMGFRMKALRKNFKSSDFVDPNITVSINMNEDTTIVRPIIFPGQTCMLSVNAIMSECLIKEEKIFENKYINLGLSYDHRVINGYDSDNFLTKIKTFLEKEF